MNKIFKRILLSNLLVTIMLIPMIMLINSLTILIPSIITWFGIGMVLFVLISYIMYKNEKNKKGEK